jgi:hypothetical protein
VLELEIRRHLKISPQNPDASAWTYPKLDERQRQIAERVRSGGHGALLLSELAPVITVGRRTATSDLLMSESALSSLGSGV